MSINTKTPDEHKQTNPQPQPLNADLYYEATKLTQVVSVDLILTNEQGKILVGKRHNKPAQGFYFVPGGRVYLWESITDAAERISQNELGWKLCKSNLLHIGVYEHKYPDNFKDDTHGTHYVVFAFQGAVDSGKIDQVAFEKQHSELRWMTKDELIHDPLVHPWTRQYFETRNHAVALRAH